MSVIPTKPFHSEYTDNKE